MNDNIRSKIVTVVTIVNGQEIIGFDREYRDIYVDGRREFGVNIDMGDGTWYRLIVGVNRRGARKYTSLVHFAPVMGDGTYGDVCIDIPKNHPQALPHWEDLVKDVVEYLNSV